MNNPIGPSEEQLAYAHVLDWGMKIGFLLMIFTFSVYIFELIPSAIPVNILPQYWGLDLQNYLQVTHIQPGWTWVKNLSKGDFLNFLPIAFLAGLTIFCYGRVLPIFFKKKDTLYGILVILQILVLVLAASGLLKVKGH